MNREDWFKNLIQEFREKYKELSEGERKNINLDDLTEPCQILSITFEYPPLTKTFILHLPHIKDEKVWAYGPIKPYEAFELFEKIISDPVWDIPIDTDEQYVLFFLEGEPIVRTLLDRDLRSILREIQRNVFNPIFLDIPTHKQYFLKNSAIWSCYGDITKADPASMVVSIIHNAKNACQNEQAQKTVEILAKTEPQKIQEHSEPIYKWHGTFLFPPVYIGKAPKVPFSEELFEEIHIIKFGTVVFEGKFNGQNVIATYDGFVGVEEIENKVALEILNVLVATFFLRGTLSYVIREHELGHFQYDINSKKFGGSSIPMLPRFSIQYEQKSAEPFFRRRTKLTHKELGETLKDAELYWNNPKLRFYIPFFLESYTHFSESEYTQSFFMSWVIIEKYLTGKWEDFLKEKGISGGFKKEISKWNIDKIIKSINLQEILLNADYEILMKMKQKRNEILHGTIRATKEDAEKVLSLARYIIKKEA
jgi:hypothetical protein